MNALTGSLLAGLNRESKRTYLAPLASVSTLHQPTSIQVAFNLVSPPQHREPPWRFKTGFVKSSEFDKGVEYPSSM